MGGDRRAGPVGGHEQLRLPDRLRTRGGRGREARYRDTFLTELGRLGYAAKTIGDYQRAIDGFCAQVEARGFDAGEIGIELPAGQERKGCIARFTEHLIDAGVMAPPSPAVSPAPGSFDELSQAYGDWLHHHRGLSAKTISIRQSVLRGFLTFRFGTTPGDLNTIARGDIAAFLDSPDTATGTARTMGIDVARYKLTAFVLGTGLAGLPRRRAPRRAPAVPARATA